MSVDSRERLTLPSGLILITEIEDGYISCVVADDPDDNGDHTFVVDDKPRWDGLAFEMPPCLGAEFEGGGWCDLMVCTLAEIDALGGLARITEVKMIRR